MKAIIFLTLVLGSAIVWQGCSSEETPEPVDCSEDPVQLSVVSVENTDCNAADGSIEVVATGGSGSYAYSMGGGAGQTSSVFNNLAAGTYTITALDANNCSGTLDVTVTNADGMNVSFETSSAGCKESDGSITAIATDGTEPYQFKVGNGSFTSDNVFSGLSMGTHEVVVSDATGCTVTQTVRVPSGVSFSASVSPIISSKCAINTCHNGTQFPDFRVAKNIHDNAAKIKSLTADGTMPQEGSLTQAEKDLIACWVDDGAPDN